MPSTLLEYGHRQTAAYLELQALGRDGTVLTSSYANNGTITPIKEEEKHTPTVPTLEYLITRMIRNARDSGTTQRLLAALRWSD